MVEHDDNGNILWTCGICGRKIPISDTRHTYDNKKGCKTCLARCHGCNRKTAIKEMTKHQDFFYCKLCPHK